MSVLLLAAAGCGVEDGDYVMPSVSSAPGSLVQGRYFEHTACNANAGGVIACTSSCRPIVYFLDASLATVERVQTAPLNDLAACSAPAINSRGETANLGSGGGFAIVHADRSVDRVNPAFRIDTGNTFVFGDDLIGVLSHTDALVALDPTTGAVAWMRAAPSITALAPGFGGGFVVGGTFTGTLDLGGMTSPFMWGVPAGWVGRLDDAGVATWAQPIVGTTSAMVENVAVGPHGEIAMLASWQGDGALGTIDLGKSAHTVALFDATGVLQWHHELSGAPDPYVLTSLLTDGNDIYLTRGGDLRRFDASGVVWDGGSSFTARLFALTGDSLIVSFDAIPTMVLTPPTDFRYRDVEEQFDAPGSIVSRLVP